MTQLRYTLSGKIRWIAMFFLSVSVFTAHAQKRDTLAQKRSAAAVAEEDPVSPMAGLFNDNLITPSPDGCALVRSVTTPVDKYSGVASIQIPITEFKIDEASIPVSLTYRGGGIRVDEVASSVGLGWKLSAGGRITRMVKGYPDDLENFSNRRIMLDEAGWTWGTYADRQEDQFDTQPDYFYFEYPGGGGMFVFDENGTPRTVPGQKIDIRCENGHFVITDTNGTSYFYFTTETSSYTMKDVDPKPKDTYVSTWFLDQIEYANGAVVYFDYIQSTDYSYVNYNATSRFTYSPQEGFTRRRTTAEDVTNTTIRPKLLSAIRYRGYKIEFSYTSRRTDIPGMSELVEIRSLYDGVEKKVYALGYGKFANGNLKLTQVLDYSNRRAVQPVCSFVYYENVNLPARSSYATDHWGYFNNAATGSKCHPLLQMRLGSTHGIDKTPNATYAVANTLKKIRYATGGSKEFFYELHAGIDPSTGERVSGGGLRTKEIHERADSLSQPAVTSYAYRDGTVYTPHPNYCTWADEDYTVSGAQDTTYRSCVYDISARPLEPMTDLNGCSVIYGTVVERMPDRSSVEYEYVAYDKAPDEAPTHFELESFFGGLSREINARVPKTSMHWKRNLLQEKREYDADARLVRRTKYHYTFPTQNRYLVPGMKSYTSDYSEYVSRPVFGTVVRFSKYTIYAAPVYMVQEIVEKGPFNLASTTNYVYDYDRMLPTGVQRIDSDGNRIQTLVTYPSDYATASGADEYLAGLAGLKARKAETMPVETIKLRNNILVDATLNLYKMVNGRPMLAEVRQFFPERPEGMLGFGRCRVENGGLVYDPRYESVMRNTDFSLENRVLSSVSQGDRRQSVVYGYDGTLPIAAVPNVRHSVNEEIAGRSAVPLRDPGQVFTVFRRHDVGFVLDFIGNNAPHKELCVEVRRQSDQSTVYRLYMVPVKDYSRFFANLEAGDYQLAVRWADAGDTSPLPPIEVSVEEESLQSIPGRENEVFHTSFEPGSAGLPAAQYLKKVATAKTGEWVCTGNYTLSFTGFKAGTYDLSYWTYDTAAAAWSRTWKIVTVDDTHRSYTISASASRYIDEVRFIPRNAHLTTFTYDPVHGKTSETDLNETTTYYTYDASGRLASVLDNDRSLRKRYTYQGMTKVSEETRNGRAELNRKVTYLDGLGRPEQIVECGASPTNKDIVHFIDYDEMGRDDAVTNLPYTVAGGGVKRHNPYGEQVSFYFSMYGSATAIYPYHYRFYDRSPLGLLLKERRPKDHRNAEELYETVYEYRLNTAADSIRRYMMRGDSAVVWNGYYPESTLMVKKTTIPVTSLDDRSVVYEYTDAENRLVANEVRVSAGDRRMTYNVYDGLGRQRYLIPPAGNALFAVSGTAHNPHELHAYCYYYVYDKYGNAIQTLIPGSDWQYSLYDKRGRLVLSQKGELRDQDDPARDRWTFTRYDALDRPVATGIYHGGTLQIHRAALAQQTDFSSSYPALGSDAEILSSTEYDNYGGEHFYFTYNYEKKINRDGTVVAFQTRADRAPARGRVTRRVNKVLNPGENRSLATTFYYDAEGHTIQTVTDLYPSGTERVINHLDEAGNVVYVYACQTYGNYRCGYGKTLYYDKQNRLTDISQIMFENHGERIIGPEGLPNDDPRNGRVWIASYAYDELGRLASKTIHSGAEKTNYKHDIRGMLLSSESPSFSYRLSYDNPTVPGVTARFNGIPGSQTWSRAGGTEQGYRYTYDRMGQLVEGEMMERTEGVWGAINRCKEQMAYDRSGNIAAIERTTYDGRPMAPISLTYDGYRLMQATTPSTSFTFAYDRDGNLTDDGSRKARMEYNILGLPQKVYTDTHEVCYIYSADGTKLATVTDGAFTFYRGVFTFEHGRYGSEELVSVQHPEGFVACNGYRHYTYKYFKSDHTRSNRALLSIYQGAIEIEQEMDYMPFGLSHVNRNLHLNRKLYAGKEMQDASSSKLTWYDFGARHYYPMFGRWFSVDPALQGFNPYMYCGNAPTAYIDKDGRFFWWIVGAAALLGGYMGGAAAEKDWNVLDWAWDGKTWGGIFGGAIQGAIGGATMGYGISALSGPFFSEKGFSLAGKIFRYSSLTFTAAKTFATGASMVNNFSNAMDIIRGNYMYSGKTFGGQIWRGISRATWQRPQQYVGYTYSQGRNGFHKGIEVEYFHGATVVDDPGSSDHRGITMGNMINGWQIHKNNDSMLYHEYGHTIQSSLWGVLYLPVVGVSSAIAAKNNARDAWTETAANRYSRDYFGQDVWDRTAGSIGGGSEYPLQ